MYAVRRTAKRGFTLVEILIVVIILGILAAIVIPQFTNASQDARKSSLVSQLQTIRSQIELYKLQHRDAWPTATGLVAAAWDWSKLTAKTNDDGTVTGTPDLGPYLQASPRNSISSLADPTTVFSSGTTIAGAGAAVATPSGWAFSQPDGKFYATNKTGAKVFDEGDLNAPANDQ